MLEYQEQQQARHYYHGAQYTPEEMKILKERRQPIIVFNRTKRKIDQISGLLQRLRGDPKAFPRHPNNADGAEVATQAVRSILDGSEWEFIESFAITQAAIEGIGGIELKLVQGDHQDPDIGMDVVFGEDYFYDPRSRKPDFSDARYHGIAKWLDVEAAVELFPERESELRTLMVETGFDLTTHADHEFKWIYTNEKRLRLCEIWYRFKGKWYWAFFCSMILLAQGVSPFLDERGQPMSRFIMMSANVDHDADRYGFVRDLKGPQDELNHRRSKALFMSNVSRLILRKGAVDNVERTRIEYARPDGVVEVNPGFDLPIPDPKVSGDLDKQLLLMQDARNEIDSFANISPDLITRDIPGDHSGVAINQLQKAGIAELGSFLRNAKNWKKRVYKCCWNIAQRTWKSERFIRIAGTDAQGLAQFIQINGQGYNQFGQPVIINAIGNMSVEMSMDEGPDEANLMQDAYDVLKQYPPGVIPPAVLIELAPLSSSMKQRVQQLMQQPVDPLAMQAKSLALRKVAAEVSEVDARAQRHRTQSVSDQASAAHKLSEAGLNAQEGFIRGQQAAQGPSASPEAPQPSPAQNFGGLGGPTPGGPPGPGGPGAAPVMPPGAVPGMPRMPTMPPLRKARDGRYYTPDPNRPGKFLMMVA